MKLLSVIVVSAQAQFGAQIGMLENSPINLMTFNQSNETTLDIEQRNLLGDTIPERQLSVPMQQAVQGQFFQLIKNSG